MAKNNYYVVFHGKIPGVYDSLNECQNQVHGFSNSRFKGFKTKIEADSAFQKSLQGSQKKTQMPIINKNIGDSKSKSFRFTIPSYWEHFITCILLHLLIPLVPIFLELIFTAKLSTKTLTLSAAIYAITIGRTTSSSAQFALSIIISLIFSACYGITVASNGDESITNLNYFAGGAIVFIFIVHILERYNKHVVDRIPFLELKRS